MLAGILSALTVIGQLLVLVNKIIDANKEKDEAIRKEKTKALQSGIRAIVDRDTTRFTTALYDIHRLQR